MKYSLPSDKTPLCPTRILCGLFLLVASTAFIWGLLLEYNLERRLAESEASTEAEITGFTKDYAQNKRRMSYSIQYSYIVDGVAFTGGDITGRENLWIRVSKSRWEALQDDPELMVRYVPDRPAFSGIEPVSTPGLFLITVYAGISSILALLGAWLVFVRGPRTGPTGGERPVDVVSVVVACELAQSVPDLMDVEALD